MPQAETQEDVITPTSQYLTDTLSQVLLRYAERLLMNSLNGIVAAFNTMRALVCLVMINQIQ